jgi:hypothetical protein
MARPGPPLFFVTDVDATVERENMSRLNPEWCSSAERMKNFRPGLEPMNKETVVDRQRKLEVRVLKGKEVVELPGRQKKLEEDAKE